MSDATHAKHTTYTTQYIVIVKGSPLNGHTSHIEKVLLPNGVENTLPNIQNQIKAQLYARRQTYPEEAYLPTRFIVKVDGSPSDGYTADAENIKPRKVPTKEELQTQREVVKKAVEEAFNTAKAAADSALYFLGKMDLRTNIEVEKIILGNEAKDVIATAVTAAQKAVDTIRDEDYYEIKDEILKGNMDDMLDRALVMSSTSNIMMEKILDEINPKSGLIIVKEVNRELRNDIRVLKKVTDQAYYLWKDINERITSSSKGGNHKYRNHTCRKHKQYKKSTLRKS